ncbi:MAG: hypothetical protein K9M54_12635 [Kiritimatiellales bacterium]|nr:hypothetical protein [Kiritimatiellales bacterium]MCF7864109.1 hypothetical protein [Kiritimatiellales bacterium]
MRSLRITYVDSCGEISERTISDFHQENQNSIDAFCHLRNERRSLRADRILNVTDPETNESLNPYEVFLNQNDTNSISCAIWRALPAIRALKFFTMYSRGLRKREKVILSKFVEKQLPNNCFSQEEIENWIHKLDYSDLYVQLNGDTEPYKAMLCSIPADLLPLCRDFAFIIASGSGRKPIPPSLEMRVINEFSDTPIVQNPLEP